MIKIYAEWMLADVFHQGEFGSWDDYHRAVFNPNIKLLRLVEWCGDKMQTFVAE